MILGGGASTSWSGAGSRTDSDYFASEAGDARWRYESVLALYRRIEDWGGAPGPAYRGGGGPVYVEPTRDHAAGERRDSRAATTPAANP
jgi:choline dehydrogenase